MSDADAALAAYLRQIGHEVAADVITYGKTGIVGIPRSLRDTRDGREEAIEALKDAMEGNCSVIVIEDACKHVNAHSYDYGGEVPGGLYCEDCSTELGPTR